MTEKSGFPFPHTRRSVVAAAGGAGLAAVLTACGGSGDDSSGTRRSGASGGKAPAGSPSGAGGNGGTGGNGDSSGSTPGSGAGATPGSGSASASGSGPGDGGSALAKTSEIPVGGGKVFADQKVVVTQPTAGRFQGFSAVCTHQGCTVSDVSGGTINCPCHGSRFHVADGSVAAGPAVSPLPSKPVKVSGSEITLA